MIPGVTEPGGGTCMVMPCSSLAVGMGVDPDGRSSEGAEGMAAVGVPFGSRLVAAVRVFFAGVVEAARPPRPL